jgi:hypothetical protein
MSLREFTTLSGILLTLAIFAHPAGASTFVYATGNNASVGGFGVNDWISITLDPNDGKITVQIQNLEQNPARDFQLISSVQIFMSGLDASNLTTPSVFSSSFSAVQVEGANPTAVTPTPSNAWGFATATGVNWGGAYSVGNGINGGKGDLTFCTNCPSGGNKQLIISGPDTNNQYDNPSLNNSITTAAHNPYILGSGATYTTGPFAGLNSSPSWVLTVPQLTASTVVTDVVFGYGTAWGTYEYDFNPEPGTTILIGSGLAAMCWVARRRRLRAASQSER